MEKAEVQDFAIGKGFSPEALEMTLRRWLSVTESQICALEVLCSQLPKVNILLEDNMEALSDNFGILASNANKQTENVENIVKAVTELELNGEKTTTKEALKAVSEEADGAVKQKIDAIIAGMGNQDSVLQEALETAENSSSQMRDGVSGAIIGMQFQDRVSQNLVIAINVSKEMVKYLQEAIDSTRHQIEEHGAIELDKKFAKDIIAYLNLGELQQQFIHHLIEHHYIEDASELDFDPDASALAAAEHNEDMELF